MKYTSSGYSGCRFINLAFLMILLSACSSKNNLTPAPMPSVAPSRSAAAQLLTGLAEQLDALKEQLKEVRNTQPTPVPSSASIPRPSNSSSPSPQASSKPASTSSTSPCQPGNPDLDQDKLPDSCEDFLADTYAPVVYHSSKESYFPTSVVAFLPQTSLWFSDKECSTTLSAKVLTAPSPAQLIAQTYPASCGGAVPTYSNKTRSKEKQRSFYLANLAEEARAGSTNAQDWVTYTHVYRNNLNGATIQYWRFYAYDGENDHGGDWEGIHVVLNSDFRPVRIVSIHENEGLKTIPWSELDTEGASKTHPRIYIEPNSHVNHTVAKEVSASGCKGIGGFFSCSLNPETPETFVRHETWKNGKISWFNGESGISPGLSNVGSKLKPLNQHVFIQYSGLWGSPARRFDAAGYWGPAYHHSGLLETSFLSAWGQGILEPQREEVYPVAVSP